MALKQRPNKSYDIFLSYANDDLPRVGPLVQALESRGWRVWWDRRIPAGRTFRRVIATALDDSRCVVVVWTETSIERNWVLEEAQEGADRESLIPVFLDNIRAPLGFRLIQGARLDAWDGDASSQAFQRLHNDLVDYLGAPAASPSVIPEDVATKTPEVEPQAEEPELAPEFLDKRVINPVGMEFVLIPDGTFQMGSADGDDDEQPVHSVRISQPFYLGVTPVTQTQWEAVMGDNPSEFKDDANCPVESVSWEDVQGFLAKLEERDPGVRYRLPTESEWEYAARAGTMTAYSFGDDASELGEYAWYNANSGGKTHPVGQLKANGWDLCDMHGNVWEWVQDWYGDYTAATADAPAVDPRGSAGGADRVIRGGGWVSHARSCRSSYRVLYDPGYRSPGVGFRVLRFV